MVQVYMETSKAGIYILDSACLNDLNITDQNQDTKKREPYIDLPCLHNEWKIAFKGDKSSQAYVYNQLISIELEQDATPQDYGILIYVQFVWATVLYWIAMATIVSTKSHQHTCYKKANINQTLRTVYAMFTLNTF